MLIYFTFCMIQRVFLDFLVIYVKIIVYSLTIGVCFMYHIIVNPQGGKGKSLKALATVEETLKSKNIPYIVHKTEYPGHATEITRELSKAPDTVILMMGGDGSFNEILNGIEDFDNVTLGILPCGTGNDFVKASGHPANVKDALDVVLKNNVGHLDYIQLGDRRCLNVLGAGMDVDVLLKYAEMKAFHGKFKYYASLLYTLAHTRWHKLRFTLDDGEPMERTTFMIGIGNGKCIGGGMPICPNGIPDDGKLDVVIVNEMKKGRIPFELPKFLKGKHVKRDYTEEYTARKVKIEVLDDSKFEADGEVFDAKVIECEVVSNKLKVFR